MSLSPRTRSTLREYWADRLGVTPDAFAEEGVTVGLTDEEGIPLFHCNDAVVVGAPDSLTDQIKRESDALATLDAGDGHRATSVEREVASNEREVTSDNEIREWFDTFDAVERVLGPAFWGYTDRESFDPVESEARVLTPDDESAYDAFRARIPDEEWDQGGPQFAPGNTVGLLVGDDLVAASGYEVWDELVAHLAVVTHPDYRGDGYGRAVVSRATENALEEGLIPQYRTLDEWPWSVALARSLGFDRFATGYLGVAPQ